MTGDQAVLQADTATGKGSGDDRFAAIGKNKQESTAIKFPRCAGRFPAARSN